jgi:hypothetical protein
MKLFRILLLGIAFAFVILGCGILLCSIYLSDEPWYTLTPAYWCCFACLSIAGIFFALRQLAPKLKRLKPLFKKLAIGCGILLIVFALFLLEENVRGKIALHSYIRQLRAQGEKLTLAEIDLPNPAKEENGAPALVALTNQFHSLRKDCPFAIGGLTRTRLVAQGRGVVRTKQADLGVDHIPISYEPGEGPAPRRWNRGREAATNSPAPIQASWADLDEQTAKASNALVAVKTALAQPALNVEIDYTQGYEIQLRHLQATYDARNWLTLSALNDIHHRNLEAATENILTIAALMRFQEDERLVISQINRWQTGLVGLDMTWEALQAPGWTDEQLATLQRAWQKNGVIQDTGSALEMERLFRREQFQQVVHSPQWNEFLRHLVTFTQNGDSDYGLRERLSEVGDSIHFIAWRLAWVDQDELRALQRYQLLLDRTRSAIARRDW